MKPLHRNLALIVIIISLSVLSSTIDTSTDNQIVKQGLNIALVIDPISGDKTKLHEGQAARVQFTIQDATSKQAIKGLHPAVWLERQHSQSTVASCKERINSYLQSQLAFKPEIDFNAYFVLTLNNDASLSVIDPINGFAGSKLITQIKLHSPAVDWTLSKDHKKLYVATPLTREVAVIDTQNWQVIRFLSFDATPTRLALQPDGQYLWVGLETAGVSVIDTDKNAVVLSIATGAGHHEFAFTDDSRTAYVSNATDKTITLIETQHLSIHNTVNTETPVTALAYSTLSKSLYAATENGKLLNINASGKIIANINTRSPLKTVRFSNEGRWGFALSQSDNKVFIIDASMNRLMQTLDVGNAPDQVSFTDNFAYIRSTGSETVNMLELSALNKNQVVSVTSFPAGQTAPTELLLSDAIVPTPERNAVVVANPSDKVVYYYTEGMSAPMGNFENVGLKPLAVMIVNRSMQETAQGVYTGITQLPPAGDYSVSILLDNPPVYHCFATTIASNSMQVEQTIPVKVNYLLNKQENPVGVSIPIKLKLTNALQDKVNDIQVLVFRIPAQWQQRLLAKPLGNHLYQVEITPSEAGVYQVFTQSPTLNFTFDQQPTLTFRAVKL